MRPEHIKILGTVNMKRIAAFALIGTLATAGAVSAQEAAPTDVDPFLATAGPAAGLKPEVLAAGFTFLVIGVAALSKNKSSSGSD